MYIIFNLMPDGDTYGLFKDKGEARDAFEDYKLNWDISDEESIIFAKIDNLHDFGFGARGDVYGMTIIDSINWDNE